MTFSAPAFREPRTRVSLSTYLLLLSFARVISENPYASTSQISDSCGCFIFVLLEMCLVGLDFPRLFQNHVSLSTVKTPSLTNNLLIQ